jgi:fermentation-respiration switch protein FrsA (DUF1100 family)
MMKTFLWFLLVAVGLYGCVLVLMYVSQRALMYFPETTRTSPAAAGLPQAQEVELDSSDGTRVIAWHVPPRGDRPVILYFHGNGGSLRYRAARFAGLVADGDGLIALSYRGYGGSAGTPTEQGLIADAAAAYRFAVSQYDPARLVLWGESLGSAVAIAVAAGQPVGGVILESPFTSAADVGQRAYPFLPVHLLIKDPWRSDLRVGRISAPVLVMHGDRDTVVPFALGQELYGLIQAPKHFARFSGGGHTDLDTHGALGRVRDFIGRLREDAAGARK